MPSRITTTDITNELVFTASRSDGPGGQNVNKVNSKVTLRFDIPNSRILHDEDKAFLQKKLAAQLTKEGTIVITAQEHRSQLQNKEAARLKFELLLAKAYERKKRRRPTKPSKGAVQDRISQKKRVGEKKKWRQKP